MGKIGVARVAEAAVSVEVLVSSLSQQALSRPKRGLEWWTCSNEHFSKLKVLPLKIRRLTTWMPQNDGPHFESQMVQQQVYRNLSVFTVSLEWGSLGKSEERAHGQGCR